ncbi:MAG: vWA domain-containing protein [Pirellulaceae bacterium]
MPPRSSDVRPAAEVVTSWESGRDALPWRKEMGAWLLSMAFHVALLVALALAIPVSLRGVALEPARGGGIVLARGEEGEVEYFAGGEAASHAADEPQSEATLQAALPSGEQIPVELPGALPTSDGSVASSGVDAALPSASGFTGGSGAGSGRGSGRGSGNYARTSIFGAQGTGNKLVYVFDRSASTDGYQGRPLAAAKRELMASLNDLQDVHQFQIVFYNERPTVFNPTYPQPPRMLFGDSPTKRLAKNFVRGVVSAGSTHHLDALKLALGMRPDVIFFLTDAGEPQLTASEVEEVRQRNQRVGAQLNTIEFGVGPTSGGRNFLVRLAEENDGQYVYVDVTRLPSAAVSLEQ